MEWPIEMGDNFSTVYSAVGRAVNSHRSEQMLILVFICFGELHVTGGRDCRMEAVQNARCKTGLRRLLTLVLQLWKTMWRLCTCRHMRACLPLCLRCSLG